MEKAIKPSRDLLALPLDVRATMAFNAAVDKVIEEHTRLGLPLPIWRDGKVVEVSPEELRNPS